MRKKVIDENIVKKIEKNRKETIESVKDTYNSIAYHELKYLKSLKNKAPFFLVLI